MYRRTILALLAALLASASGSDTLRIWPNAAPDSTTAVGPEKVESKPDQLVGGKTITGVTNVTEPALTLFRAARPAPLRPAVVVFPGGGYYILAMDIEGTEICHFLNEKGITAILLKYRVPRRKGLPPYQLPLEDAQRAMGLIRQHAQAWNINPDHVGVIGFSAGGSLAAALSNNFNARTYAVLDHADQLSCRPDFVALIYPAYLTAPEGSDNLAPEMKVTPDTPPTFIVQTEDDPIHIENSLAYYQALKKARVSAEMHLFSRGGHGYGLRDTKAPVNRWSQELSGWLRDDLKLIPH